MQPIPSDEILKKIVTVTILNKQGQQIDQFEMRGGMNLWVFLRKRGLPIGSACSGVGVCGACHIKVIENESRSESLSPKNDFERNTLARNDKPDSERLACLCRVYADVTIQADYW